MKDEFENPNDQDVIENLDLLLNFEILDSEKDWDAVENWNELDKLPMEEPED